MIICEFKYNCTQRTKEILNIIKSVIKMWETKSGREKRKNVYFNNKIY